MDPDHERIAEIEALFEANGWQLHLNEVDGVWEATAGITETTVGQMLPAPYGQGATRLEAAETAWTTSQDEPWLGKGDRPA
jgi:hypothetical protein